MAEWVGKDVCWVLKDEEDLAREVTGRNISLGEKVKGQDLKIQSIPSNSTPKYVPMKNDNICSHKNLYINVHSSLFIIAKRWKQPKCPSKDEWINKM